MFAMLGVSVAAACIGNGNAGATPEFRQAETACSGGSLSAVAQASQPDEALFQEGAFGDPIVVVSRSGGGSRLLSARLALSCFELARLLAQSSSAQTEFLPAPDTAPQILLWLASHLEVRAGPAVV